MPPSVNPLVGFHFWVEIQGVVTGAFRECSGLDSEHDVVEYKASDKMGEEMTIKVPGRIKHPNVELKRGMTQSMDFWNWRKQVEDGDYPGCLRNGSVILYDQKHAEVARWNFTDAWPSKVTGPQLNSSNNDIAVEGVTIIVGDMKRVK